MAQWNHADKTLYTKIVYYGPAFGGKTTNLEALHRLTDPEGEASLVSVKTADDRTLFFDLLPVDLGDLLGYRVAIKLYTVPGQVRYDATRRVVLAGADAVVFVADSSTGREEQNRWSLQNLRMHMRELRLDPSSVPIVFQFNKQDLDDAAPPEIVARWLRLDPADGEPAVAVSGRGVLETFVRVGREMLASLVAHADDRTRQGIDAADLAAHLEDAFSRFRSADGGVAQAAGPHLPIVVDDDDTQRSAVRAGVRLGESLTAHAATARRLEREVEALRALADGARAVGATFDRDEIADSALRTAAEVLGPATACLLAIAGDGARVDREEAAGTAGAATPRPLPEAVVRAARRRRVAVVDDLAASGGPGTRGAGRAPRAAVVAPVDDGHALLVWTGEEERRFGAADTRFVATVAAHLAVGLEKARLYTQVGDRVPGDASHDERSPLTTILEAASRLRDSCGDDDERAGLAASIVAAGERLHGHLDSLIRLAGLDDGGDAPAPSDTDVARILDRAARLAGRADVETEIADGLPALVADEARLGRAIANLIDNAFTYSPDPAGVRVAAAAGEDGESLVVAVLDRGPGVPVEERDRIFAPFERGGVGLGLHEARRIVEAHGGAIECLDRPGGGAEFRVVLPLHVAAGATAGPSRA